MIFNNRKVIENYFFMTILQVLNSFFYLLIYPYLIRALGGEQYGVFVFATSVAAYFTFLVNFGFDLPATKIIAQNVENKMVLSDTVSAVFTAKTYLFLLSVIVFIFLLYFMPLFRSNWMVFSLCFVVIFSNVLFPHWFFQGVQKMKVVTGIQLTFKIVSLPFIFWLVKDRDDVVWYALIVSMSTLLGGVVAFTMLRYQYRLRISWKSVRSLRKWFQEAMPFFLSSMAGAVKEYSIPVIIGAFFGMREVAIYDLANKIVIVPRTLFMSVNAAIFPKLIINIQNRIVKRIILVEALISIVVILLIVIFGKYIVQAMGGEGMEQSYYLAVLLSITVMSWLVVGAYINFVFIPNQKNYYATHNQLIALGSFTIFTAIGLFLSNSILVLGGAVALSGIFEILYCKYRVFKDKMLK